SAAPADLKITPRAMKYMQEQGLTAADVADVKGTGFDGGITERDLKKASPLAKKTAQKLGVDLNQVEGSGVGGKVMKADVEAAAAAPKAPAAPADGRKILKTVPYKGVRKIIGDRLAESKFTAPHLYFTDSIDMTNFTAFRKELNAKNDVKIAASDLFVKAASKALTKYPAINSSLVDGQIIQYESTNVGMAVAGDNGLIVPVVKDAQAKTLTQIAGETRDLVERAKAGRLKQEEYNGGTFSISNLGMFGIENFTAIINPPEAAILSISSIRMKPVAVQNADGEYEMAIRPMMNVQLSVDHRIIDGLDASQFVKYFKELIEEPIKILI
ncbi:MAG: 2-oxo acid dehydrogenase subunit E2, partial [Lachnospiraceae bacterium]|nr:2-oxo acid dehydrogenase subunit E2 [Lachnospiraceae bacterium]